MAQLTIEGRDANILEHILSYCQESEQALKELAPTRDAFLGNRVCQNSVAMCVLQIGELVKHLSFGFTEEHPDIPWHSIARTRDLYAHHYLTLDVGVLYETATEGLSDLKSFCEAILKKNADE